MITICSPRSFFILRTSATGSPFASLVLFHDTFFRVLENTTLGRLFICFATTGNCSAAAGVGQKLAIIS